MTASTVLGKRFLDAMGEFAQDFEDPRGQLGAHRVPPGRHR
jgi:hypothetical protein